LNPNVIKAPSTYIEYVIIHEFCHLKFAFHNSAFFDLLQRILPDWEKRNSSWKRLDRHLFSLFKISVDFFSLHFDFHF